MISMIIEMFRFCDKKKCDSDLVLEYDTISETFFIRRGNLILRNIKCTEYGKQSMLVAWNAFQCLIENSVLPRLRSRLAQSQGGNLFEKL